MSSTIHKLILSFIWVLDKSNTILRLTAFAQVVNWNYFTSQKIIKESLKATP